MSSDAFWNPGAGAERRQLALFGAVAAVVAGAAHFLFAATTLPLVLGTAASFALAGAALHRFIGRPVYLLLALVASAIRAVVSRVVIALAYLLAIVGVGSLLRLFRMDLLRRDFAAARAATTLFVDAPVSDRESFGRQS